MSGLTELTLDEIQRGLREGAFSSLELTHAFLNRIEKFEPEVKYLLAMLVA